MYYLEDLNLLFGMIQDLSLIKGLIPAIQWICQYNILEKKIETFLADTLWGAFGSRFAALTRLRSAELRILEWDKDAWKYVERFQLVDETVNSVSSSLSKH